MEITFKLPPAAAELLLRLMEHIRHHAGEEPDADMLCRSLIVDILIDDAMAHSDCLAMPQESTLAH